MALELQVSNNNMLHDCKDKCKWKPYDYCCFSIAKRYAKTKLISYAWAERIIYLSNPKMGKTKFELFV